MGKHTIEDFWGKVAVTPHCWTWTGKPTRQGYCLAMVDGKRKVAHKVAYENLVGAVPKGLQLDHLCHNRSCVNPYHLRLATNKQNSENRKGASKGNISGYRGVSYHKVKGRWGASVRHNYKLHYLGYYPPYELHVAGYKAMMKRNELFTHNDKDR